MKITQAHQEKLESLMSEEAQKMGAADLKDFISKVRADIKAGNLPSWNKEESCFIFGFLFRGAALRFVCDEIYSYADDSHLTTFKKRLFAKHA